MHGMVSSKREVRVGREMEGQKEAHLLLGRPPSRRPALQNARGSGEEGDRKGLRERGPIREGRKEAGPLITASTREAQALVLC